MELTQIYELIKPHVHSAEIRQADGDSGDSAQRDGTFWAIAGILRPEISLSDPTYAELSYSYEGAMRAHEVRPGYYRRTNDSAHWGYNGNNFSRDQFSVLQLAFAVNRDKPRLKQSMLALLKRGFLHQNWHAGTDCKGYKCLRIPDISAPTHFSVFIRGMGFKWARPILEVLDFTFLADLYFRKKRPWDYDNMLLPQLAYANLERPTFAARLAWKLLDKKDALAKVRTYHSTENGNNGINGFYQLFELLVKKVEAARD